MGDAPLQCFENQVSACSIAAGLSRSGGGLRQSVAMSDGRFATKRLSRLCHRVAIGYCDASGGMLLKLLQVSDGMRLAAFRYQDCGWSMERGASAGGITHCGGLPGTGHFVTIGAPEACRRQNNDKSQRRTANPGPAVSGWVWHVFVMET